MSTPKWRRVMAATVDVCAGGLPALLLVGGWATVIQGTVESGFGALLYYGLPLLLFTGTGFMWAYWMWRAHRGTLSLRSVGLVVAGLEYRESALVRASLRPRTLRGMALRVGATAMATLNVLVVGFALYQAIFLTWSLVVN